MVLAQKTMVEALRVSARMMAVDTPNDASPGTYLFALWSTGHLRWQDVYVKRDETSHALAQKDIVAERMKRVCIGGSIIQIETTRYPTGPMYSGLLMDDEVNLYFFLAVRSTGKLVKGSPA